MLRRTFLVWAASQGKKTAGAFAKAAAEEGSPPGSAAEVPDRATTLGDFARHQPSSSRRGNAGFSGDGAESRHSSRGERTWQHGGGGEDRSSFFPVDGVTVPPSNLPQEQYAKVGYDFVERFHSAGPRAALGGIQSNLALITVVGSAVILYCIYYLTTYKFTITTDPAPQRNTMFQRYPSDYVVLVNKWTGRRRVIQVQPAPAEQRRPDGTLPYNDRVIHVNRIKDRLIVYQQPTTTTVIVDVAPLLAPDRFIKTKDRSGRASVAVRRADQLLPGDKAEQSAMAKTAKLDGPAAAASPKHQFVVETEMRMRDVKNGGAQGNILAFRETIAHVLADKLVARLYDALLERTMRGGTKRVYAEAMIENGAVTADGFRVAELVPDLASFEDEVFAEVKKRMGDDTLLYHHKMNLI